MAQIAIGNLVCGDGTHIPLGPISITDANTSQEVTTDPAFTVTAQSVGDFAAGRTIVQGIVTAKTFAGWAYLLRNGVVECIIPVPLCNPVTLRPGDKILFYVDA